MIHRSQPGAHRRFRLDTDRGKHVITLESGVTCSSKAMPALKGQAVTGHLFFKACSGLSTSR